MFTKQLLNVLVGIYKKLIGGDCLFRLKQAVNLEGEVTAGLNDVRLSFMQGVLHYYWDECTTSTEEREIERHGSLASETNANICTELNIKIKSN